MSRVSVFLCGVVLLAAVAVPISGAYEMKKDNDMQDAAHRTAGMIDSFWGSEADIMTLRGWDVLPSADCTMELEDHHLTLSKNGRTYGSLISHPAEEMTLSYNGTLNIERKGDTLVRTDQ
jgi:hypothetical protein